MKRLLLIIAVFGLFVLTISGAQATTRREVLGESTVAADLEFPQTQYGTGLFLPNNPLFFLDQLFQDIKLLFATTSIDKANVEKSVIGEREAELRAMLATNDQKAIDMALENLTDEIDRASGDLTDGAEKGEDVEEAAKILNEILKHQREVLGSLSDQSDGSLEHDFSSAREKIKISKFVVEDQLPESLLENEVEDDIEIEIEDEAENTQDSARRLHRAIEVLEREASDAAKKQQTKREAVLRRVIADKLEKLSEDEDTEGNDSKEIKQARERFKKSLEKAAEDAKKLQELQEESNDQKDEIEVESENEVEDTSPDSNNDSGSGSGSNSGSGSSGSGTSGN